MFLAQRKGIPMICDPVNCLKHIFFIFLCLQATNAEEVVHRYSVLLKQIWCSATAIAEMFLDGHSRDIPDYTDGMTLIADARLRKDLVGKKCRPFKIMKSYLLIYNLSVSINSMILFRVWLVKGCVSKCYCHETDCLFCFIYLRMYMLKTPVRFFFLTCMGPLEC